ncbi:MAG TPA: tetratricopeptide repeat protein [Chitinophagaceae bacterium]|nr:tetratricopeptide repeat protein [Chitinophagaceae bacterium]
MKKLIFSVGFLVGMILCKYLPAQDSLSPDELFAKARSAAFDQKNYPLAIELSRLALNKSPGYADIRIFSGRVFTWSGQTDSARSAFEEVLRQQPDNEDAAAAYADLEYWNDNPAKALSICNNGLTFHPQSKTLLLKKAKCLSALKRFHEANAVVNA